MRIIALSDIHGQLPVISESAEVMFICGDIIPLKCRIIIHKVLNG